MPVITVNMVQGRSLALRQKLMKELTATAAECLDVDPQTIRVLLTEIPAHHWSVGGIAKAPAPPEDDDMQ